MFSRKAVYEFKKPEMDMEELELILIDAGLEELEIEDEKVFVYGDYKSFGTLSVSLEELEIELDKANLQYLPNSPIEFSEEQMIEIEKLIDRLEEDDDVHAVYTNIA